MYICKFGVQIKCIFNDNVRILCLSCNINKSKTTAKLSENSWNKCHSNCFQWSHSSLTSALIILHLRSVTLHGSWTRNDYVILEFICHSLLALKITQLQDKARYKFRNTTIVHAKWMLVWSWIRLYWFMLKIL
jgi:hypothetical protein